MSDTPDEHDGASEDLFSGERTRIAQLASGQPEQGSTLYVEAIVSLVWPYSNKDRLLSLLLAEPDVRLRSAKGQLKVTFHGSGAKEVAKSQVGIGDTVRLRLESAKWTDTGDAVLTPGRKVEWDLHFKNRVILDVRRNGSPLATVDYEGADTPPPTTTVEGALNQKTRPIQVNGYHDDSSTVFFTPAAAKGNRISSGSFIDASLDPFADDDGFVLGRGRKRTKFGRTSGAWRLVDDGEASEHDEDLGSTSEDGVAPTRETPIQHPPAGTSSLPDVIVLDDDSSPETSAVEATMPPPLAPFRPPEKPREVSLETEDVTTPRLHPLASPGLPLVSPLVKAVGASVGYFGLQPSVSSELDAISVSSLSPREPTVRTPSFPQFGPASSDIDRGPPTTFVPGLKVPATVFGQPAATSPFNSTSGGFTGLGSQPSSGFASTAIGTSSVSSPFAAPSPFIAPSASFGSGRGFASFGNLFGSGVSRGSETGVDFGFGSSATNTGPFSSVAQHGTLGPQVLPDDPAEQQEQDEVKPAEGFQTRSTAVQKDLDTLSRERSQSQETDDDMYGPARRMQRTPSVESAASRTSGSMHRSWQERLDVKAVDVKTDNIPSPPFPFPQNWNNKRQRDRRRSKQSPFLDGASDEMSESEEDAGTSQAPSEELRSAADIDLVPSISEENQGMVPSFETITKAQIALGPMLELEGLADNAQKEPQTPEVTSDDEEPDRLATDAYVHAEPELAHASDEVAIGEQLADEEIMQGELNPSSVVHEQLLTPANTQQDIQGASSPVRLQQVHSPQMPPTPGNSQLPAYADMLHLDGTDDFFPTEQSEEIVEGVLPVSELKGTAFSRPSREASNVPAVSSPYFTARRSARPSPQRETATADKVQAKEGNERVEPTQQSVVEEASEERQLSEVIQSASPRHKNRLHNMIGMATPLSYYTYLPNLDEHFNQHVDVLALCTASTDSPIRSKAGPKDYNVTLYLADSFLDNAYTVTAQLFRPYKQALPVVERGEAILLRSFKVQSRKHNMMLLSTDTSAWAVFSLSGASAKDAEYLDIQVEMAGPHVEYGSEEYMYAKRLLEWWQASGRLAHPTTTARHGDRLPQASAHEGLNKADAAGDRSELMINGNTNGRPVDPPQKTRSSRRIDNQTDNMDNSTSMNENRVPLSPVFESPSPQLSQRSRGMTSDKDANDNEPLEPSHPRPTSFTRMTRSSRRAANRTDNTGNEDDLVTADTIEQLPEISSPKTGRRTRRSTSALSTDPEILRSLRSQGTVHELRDGTKYVDGHVPTRRDGVHELRDGTKYVDENISPAGRTPSVRDASIVRELRDGTNYVDRSKSPEVRRSARNKRGGSVVHELRDGAKYTYD